LKILAIDTSGLQAGAAIVECSSECAEKSDASFVAGKYILVGEIFLNARAAKKECTPAENNSANRRSPNDTYTHSEILMPGVEQLFALTRIEPSQIDYVAYTCGPGSFTGLRIGAACALGIARSLEVPAIAVPTLDALAYNALDAGGECNVVPMLDARRGQVYTAFYLRNESGEIERKTDFLAMSIDECVTFPLHHCGTESKQILFFGDGADANKNVILNAFPNAIFPSANNNRQRASSAAIWAAEKILEGCEFPNTPEILYVRAPQAVREQAARENAK
jgi:tRNA threonylcarbamoyladenosine biosynthesis protein TsaB